MACKNGRTQLNKDQDRRLFAESAGTCLLCNARLFDAAPSTGRSVSIAERAHIVAHSTAGPRGDGNATVDYRHDPANIVLVCPTCHTIVDKSPDAYPPELLLAKKATRAAAVSRVGGTPIFDRRVDARRAVEDVLIRNKIIFSTSGPSAVDGSLPSTEEAAEWRRLVLEDIIPGNELIVAIVELNPHLTNVSDREGAELLRLHTRDLAAKHGERPLTAPARRFPQAAEKILAGDR